MKFWLDTVLPFAAVAIFSVCMAATDPIASTTIQGARDWIAALSGWAAAAAALGTIGVMVATHNKRAASELNEALVDLRIASDEAQLLQDVAMQIKAVVEATDRVDKTFLVFTSGKLQEIIRLLNTDHMTSAERIAGSLLQKSSWSQAVHYSNQARSLVDQAERYLPDGKDVPREDSLAQELHKTIETTCSKIIAYSTEIRANIDAFTPAAVRLLEHHHRAGWKIINKIRADAGKQTS